MDNDDSHRQSLEKCKLKLQDVSSHLLGRVSEKTQGPRENAVLTWMDGGDIKWCCHLENHWALGQAPLQ